MYIHTLWGLKAIFRGRTEFTPHPIVEGINNDNCECQIKRFEFPHFSVIEIPHIPPIQNHVFFRENKD